MQEILTQLRGMLEGETAIDEEEYCKVVAAYSRELKALLKKYFEVNEEGKDELRPWVNYYKQLQHYLVYLVRFSEILQVPHHSEILQTLLFIKKQDELIEKIYIALSQAQKELFSEANLKALDRALELKLKKLGMI